MWQTIWLLIKYGPSVYHAVVEIIEVIKHLGDSNKSFAANLIGQRLQRAAAEPDPIVRRRKLIDLRDEVRMHSGIDRPGLKR